MAAQKDVYLVIGGSGFVGRHIVERLLARGDVVSVFDVVQRHHDVPFYLGNITDEQQVLDALRKVSVGVLQDSSHVDADASPTVWDHLHLPHRLADTRSQGPLYLLQSQRRRHQDSHKRGHRCGRPQARLYQLCWGCIRWT